MHNALRSAVAGGALSLFLGKTRRLQCAAYLGAPAFADAELLYICHGHAWWHVVEHDLLNTLCGGCVHPSELASKNPQVTELKDGQRRVKPWRLMMKSRPSRLAFISQKIGT